MSGAAPVEDLQPPFDQPNDDVWFWQDDKDANVGWTALRGGFNGSWSTGNDGTFGPEVSLGTTLADSFGTDRVAFIKHGAAGTGATMQLGWNPDLGGGQGPGEIYSDLLGMTDKALSFLTNDGHSYEISGVFFAQGNRDTSHREGNAAAEYEVNFTRFIDAIRNEFASPTLPIVFERLGDHNINHENPVIRQNVHFVRDAQASVAANDPWASMVTSEDISKLDHAHFDAAGQIDFGQRLGNAYLNLLATSGDFDADNVLSAADVDALADAIQAMADESRFDVNSDGHLDFADMERWVRNLANTYFGDANLDGEFNTKDLVAIFQAGQYEDDVVGNSTWVTGDWNGDGDFGTNDLVLAFQDGGFEKGPRESVATVPEPSGMILSISAMLFLVVRSRRKSN